MDLKTVIEQRRIGTFSINSGVLCRRPEALREIQSNVLIVKCEHDFATQAFHYTAFCEAFDSISECSFVPEYSSILRDVGGEKLAISWMRLK